MCNASILIKSTQKNKTDFASAVLKTISNADGSVLYQNSFHSILISDNTVVIKNTDEISYTITMHLNRTEHFYVHFEKRILQGTAILLSLSKTPTKTTFSYLGGFSDNPSDLTKYDLEITPLTNNHSD